MSRTRGDPNTVIRSDAFVEKIMFKILKKGVF